MFLTSGDLHELISLRGPRRKRDPVTCRIHVGCISEAKTPNGRPVSVSVRQLRKTSGARSRPCWPPLVVAQELMRHSDPRLTGEVRTDTSAFPLFEELRKVAPSAPSLIASQKRGKTGRKLARSDQKPLADFCPQRAVELVLVQSCPSKKLEARAGIEPANASAEVAEVAGGCEGGENASSQKASQKTGFSCPELAEVVEAWPLLPVGLRAGVLALVRSAKGGAA
jgi:hypothetical protein